MNATECESKHVPQTTHDRSTSRIQMVIKLAAIPLLILLLTAEIRAQSALDGFDPNVNGFNGIGVSVIVLQPDGKVLIGGNFNSTVGGQTRNRIARLNPDGMVDTAFNPNAGGDVNSIALQADGKILVGGDFADFGGQPRNHIARLNPDGTLDTAFNPNANQIVYAIAVQADGKILVGGGFTGANSIGGQTRNRIARLDATTGLADSFDPNSDSTVSAIFSQGDGTILAGGSFSTIGGQVRKGIARLDATTGLADSFNPDANGSVSEIALQADGKILLGGGFTSVGGQMRNFIARVDPVTGLADSFNPAPDINNPFFNFIGSLAIQADGKILAGGSFTNIGGQFRNHIARLDPVTGQADSFDPRPSGSMFSDYVNAIAVQADGKIVLGGGFTSLSPNNGTTVTRNRIARVEQDGRLDQTLNLSTVGTFVLATAIQPDGKVLIGGVFNAVLGVTRHDIARLNTDGTLDPTFNPDANGAVYSIAVQRDGKLLVGGVFTNIGGQTRNNIARLDAAFGSPDSFNPNANGNVVSIAVQGDGKILAGGFFFGTGSIGGQTRNYIARLDAVTGVADSFDPNANDTVRSIAVQANGQILAGGAFTNIGGQTRNRIARLDATTGLADSFDPNANDRVVSIAVQGDGNIIAGGFFNGANSIGGQARNYIARLDVTTGLADSFDPNANGDVRSIAVQADGKILAGGVFNGPNSIGGGTRNRLARLDATTGLADLFDPDANGEVYAIAVETDGKVLAGGNFTTIGLQPRSLFARLSNDTAALQNLTRTQSAITWTRGGSSPQFTHVFFEYSTDNVNYTSLGNGTASGSNWIVTGVSLPTGINVYIRARGYHRSGYQNGSESVTELLRNTFLPGPTPTPAATATSTPVATPTATPPPTATATATPPATPAPTAASTATPTPSPTPLPARAVNISTRMRVEGGNNVLIGGFIVTGNAPKTVAVRGIGPSLGQFGISDALSDPTLELRDGGGTLIAPNDNWQDNPTDAAQLSALGLGLQDSKESGIIATLQPGGYTATLAGKNGGTGIGLVEVYDINQSADSQLGNISTRGFVLTGNNVMIGGFILGGGNDTRVVVRGIGPSLAQFGLNPVLSDPTLELRDSNGALLVSNDDWQSDPASASELSSLGLGLQDSRESGILMSLPPGAFTAVLAGKNNGTGIGLVEIYNVH